MESFLEKLKKNTLILSLIFGFFSGLIGGIAAYILITEKVERPKIYPLPLFQFFPEFRETIKETSGQFPIEVLPKNGNIFISWDEKIKVVKVEVVRSFLMEPLPSIFWQESIQAETLKDILPEEILERILEEGKPGEIIKPIFSIEASNFEQYLPTKAKDFFTKDIPEKETPEEEFFREQLLFGIRFVPQPETFLPPPYLLGDVPEGFVKISPQEILKIEKGVWYSLTLWGVDKDDRLLWAVQNFIKEF